MNDSDCRVNDSTPLVDDDNRLTIFVHGKCREQISHIEGRRNGTGPFLNMTKESINDTTDKFMTRPLDKCKPYEYRIFATNGSSIQNQTIKPNNKLNVTLISPKSNFVTVNCSWECFADAKVIVWINEIFYGEHKVTNVSPELKFHSFNTTDDKLCTSYNISVESFDKKNIKTNTALKEVNLENIIPTIENMKLEYENSSESIRVWLEPKHYDTICFCVEIKAQSTLDTKVLKVNDFPQRIQNVTACAKYNVTGVLKSNQTSLGKVLEDSIVIPSRGIQALLIKNRFNFYLNFNLLSLQTSSETSCRKL